MAIASESLLATQAAEVTAPVYPEFSRILTPDALAFVAALQREFGLRREALLRRRDEMHVDAAVPQPSLAPRRPPRRLRNAGPLGGGGRKLEGESVPP